MDNFIQSITYRYEDTKELESITSSSMSFRGIICAINDSKIVIVTSNRISVIESTNNDSINNTNSIIDKRNSRSRTRYSNLIPEIYGRPTAAQFLSSTLIIIGFSNGYFIVLDTDNHYNSNNRSNSSNYYKYVHEERIDESSIQCIQVSPLKDDGPLYVFILHYSGVLVRIPVQYFVNTQDDELDESQSDYDSTITASIRNNSSERT